jgi:sialidase-1
MDHDIIFKDSRAYATFPYLATAGNGDQICVFRSAGKKSVEASFADFPVHQDIDSQVIMAVRSSRSGKWSDPQVIWNDTRYAISDPSVTILSNGDWLVRFAKWHLVGSKDRVNLEGPLMRHFYTTGQVGSMMGNGFILSRDFGQSWREVPSVVSDKEWASALSRDSVLEISDGTLLLPVYTGYPASAECAALLRSFDNGATWGDSSRIAGDLKTNSPYRGSPSYNETSLVHLGGSELLAVVRCDLDFVTDESVFISEGGVGPLMWTISRDLGLTWEPVRSLGIWGQPGHVMALDSKALLVTYGYRRRPYGVRASLCEFNGDSLIPRKTIILRDDSYGWDCGYPCSTRNSDGTVTSAYYIHHEDRVRHVCVTNWNIDEMISLDNGPI